MGTLDHIKESLADRGYRLEEEIGRGGMAIVSRARDIRHERDVAIKVLRPELTGAVGPERFLREIRVEANLQHPHILPLHDSGEVAGLPYYVMPYVEGESLRDRLKREGQLPLEESLRLARQVASALAYAHAQGVIHRDIKPGNILLSSDQVLVADFGIAHATTEAASDRLTAPGVSVGTPEYMSPEQASGDEPVDGRSDIYSLGCVLFEMLAGEPPFTGRTAQAIIARHMQERIPSLEVVRPNIPLPVVRVVEKCLAKVPADRFATAEELIEALENPSLLGLEIRPARRIRPVWVALGAGAVVALLWLGTRVTANSATARLDSNKVVVFPLVARGFVGSPQDLGYEAALTIEASLDHADPLKWIDGWEHLDIIQRSNPDRVSARDKRDIARDRGARYYISGAVQLLGDSTVVLLRLDDAAGDSLLSQRSAKSATHDASMHRSTVDAVKGLLPQLVDPDREVDLRPLRERDAAAIALWIQGERQYRRSQFDAALDFYQRALDQDSSLVLAAIKGAQAASWNNVPASYPLAAYAVARDSLLPPRYAEFARGLLAYLTGRADTAVAWLESALSRDRDWAEAHMALGEVYYHLLPSRAPLDSLAEVQFRAASRADSGFAPPLYHLSEIAIRKGDVRQAQSLNDKFRKFKPDPERIQILETMLRCVRDGPERVDWRSLAKQHPSRVLFVAKRLSASASHLPCAEGGFSSLLAADLDESWGALFGLHALLVAQGREPEAIALLDSAVARGTGAAMILHVLGALVTPHMDPKAVAADSFVAQRRGVTYEGMQPGIRWVHGSFHARLGNSSRVRLVRDALADEAATTGDRQAHLYADALTAQLSLLEGDTASALVQFRSLASVGRRDDLEWGFGDALPVERLKLAELLLQRGNPQEAYQVASAFDHQEPIVYLYFLPASLAIRHDASSALGRKELVARYRNRLTRLGRTTLIQRVDAPTTGGGS